MTDRASLKEILKASEAFKSLRAEQEVAACLARLGWRTTQSPYYHDGKTDKLRELDVVASGYWKKPRKAGDLVAKVNLFIEVKSNSDFHILCAGSTAMPAAFGNNEYWIGYSEETLKRVEEQLSRFHMEHEDVLDFLHKLEKIAFPRSTMRTSVLRVKPPPVKHCFSAFRETNGKSDKGLDNSVLWRATSALRSAVAAAKTEKMDGLAADLGTDLEVARRLKLPFPSAMGAIESHTCRINQYLPIVVIQSRLWSAELADPEELKWIRLIQFGTFGDTQGWVDVVNFDHIEEYLRTQSEHFEQTFRRVRAKRWM
ncbi:MAG: hypothetical protein ROZ00_08830 [Denitratisoma sp.]|nr:hypothetical protein [Denitratisoma sp.]